MKFNYPDKIPKVDGGAVAPPLNEIKSTYVIGEGIVWFKFNRFGKIFDGKIMFTLFAIINTAIVIENVILRNWSCDHCFSPKYDLPLMLNDKISTREYQPNLHAVRSIRQGSVLFFLPIDYGKPPRIRDLMIRGPYPVIEDLLNYIVRNEFLFEFEN